MCKEASFLKIGQKAKFYIFNCALSNYVCKVGFKGQKIAL